MKCPKCELGMIKAIQFKMGGRNGFLCDYCGSLWFEGEKISLTTGQPIQSFTENDEFEYTFSDIENEDPESKSIMYSKFK